MPVLVVCPSCAARMRAPDGLAGREIKCPKCGGVVVVPNPAREQVEPTRTEAKAPPPESEPAGIDIEEWAADPANKAKLSAPDEPQEVGPSHGHSDGESVRGREPAWYEREPTADPSTGLGVVEFSCPACGRDVRVHESAAATTGPCPHCGVVVRFPDCDKPAPRTRSRCPHCRGAVRPTDTTCVHCGELIDVAPRTPGGTRPTNSPPASVADDPVTDGGGWGSSAGDDGAVAGGKKHPKPAEAVVKCLLLVGLISCVGCPLYFFTREPEDGARSTSRQDEPDSVPGTPGTSRSRARALSGSPSTSKRTAN